MNQKRVFMAMLAVMLSLTTWAAQKNVVWEKPLTAFNRITTRLSISRVEFCDTATVLTFHFEFPAGQEIGFTSETMLQADGKDYKVKGIKDYALNAGITIPQSGKMDLDMVFMPLPKDVKSFTFNMPGAFTINDIRDRNAKKEDLADTYWRNDKTGDWLIGFSKDKVIYDSRVWNITARNKDKSGEAIIAKDGADQLLVDVLKEKKGQRRILINNTLADCSRITSSCLPDYPTKDVTAKLADNGYRMGDSITIIGWYKDMPQEIRDLSGEFDAGYDGIFTGNNKACSAKIDSLGFFTLRMPVENTQMLYCDWNRSNVMFLAEPGETYFLLKDFAEDKTLVMGRNVRLQNELLGNRLNYAGGNYQQVQERGGIMPYLSFCDSLKNVALEELDAVCKEHPTLSSRYALFNRNYILSEFASDLMQARYRVPDYNLPKEYVDYVTANYLNKIEEPYTAWGNRYTTFIRDYRDNLAKTLQSPDVNLLRYGLLQAEKEGKIKLSDADKALIDEYVAGIEDVEEKIADAPDSLKQQIADEFNNGRLVKGINEIFGRDSVSDAVNTILWLDEYQRLLAATDSLGFSDIQRDIMFTMKIYGYINNTRKPLKPYMLEYVDANIRLDAAKQTIHELNGKYEAIGKRTLSSDNLKSNDDVKDLSEGEQIMKKIIEPFKGKIVLLDVWGTWCGPCKEALSHSQEEYERLKDYPMVYLYLANRSDDESWKNVIKEYNVTGDNVYHYNLPSAQQNAVENYLQVHSFPTYKLFDQQGNLLDVNADSRDINALKGLLDRMLGK